MKPDTETVLALLVSLQQSFHSTRLLLYRHQHLKKPILATLFLKITLILLRVPLAIFNKQQLNMKINIITLFKTVMNNERTCRLLLYFSRDVILSTSLPQKPNSRQWNWYELLQTLDIVDSWVKVVIQLKSLAELKKTKFYRFCINCREALTGNNEFIQIQLLLFENEKWHN